MRTRKCSLALAALAAACLVGPAPAAAQAFDDLLFPGVEPAGPLNPAEVSYVGYATRGSIAEVTLSELALERSENPAVQALAELLIEDHTTMLQTLQAVAAERGVALPFEISARHAVALEQLSGLTGEAFDRAYVDLLVEDHMIAVERTRDALMVATDPAVRAAAAEALPILEEHLALAIQLQEQLM